MDELVHTLLLLEQLREEAEELGDDYEIFEDAPEMPKEVERGFDPEDNQCSCLACVHLMASHGRGRN
jgi:hypothetical protein